VPTLQKEKPPIAQGRREAPRYHPDTPPGIAPGGALIAITGAPAAGSPPLVQVRFTCSCRPGLPTQAWTGEFGLAALRRRNVGLSSGLTAPSPHLLADGLPPLLEVIPVRL